VIIWQLGRQCLRDGVLGQSVVSALVTHNELLQGRVLCSAGLQLLYMHMRGCDSEHLNLVHMSRTCDNTH
jgi:hypothetical protein